MTNPVQIIGIQPEERAKTGDFAEFLFDDEVEADHPVLRRSRASSRCRRRPVSY